MQGYYQTTDTNLASVLAACGVPWATNETGQEERYLNIYDAERLRTLGYRGWELQTAARHAWEAHKPGLVVYQFTRCETLEAILKGYHTHCRRLADPDLRNQPTVPLQVDPETIGTLFAHAAANRKQMLAEWPLVTPFISVHGQNRTVKDGHKETTYGSFKLRLLTAGEGVRRRLGF